MTGRQEIQRENKGANNAVWNHLIAGLEDGEGPQTKEFKPPLEVGKGGETEVPCCLQKHCSQLLGFSPVRLISDFGHPELSGNKIMVFEATQCVVICYSGHGK